MLKKFASEAFGLSDIGKIIEQKDFNKTDIDDYIFHEDEETIYFVIKSKKDEYCFTNKAFIHLDGESAVSSKRTLHRYDYLTNPIRSVTLETAGTIDLDVEIKFQMGGRVFSIDVDKKQIEALKDLYKTLIAISNIQEQNSEKFGYVETAQNVATEVLHRSSEANTLQLFESLRTSSLDYMLKNHQAYKRSDFGEVFSKYINN